MGQADQQILEQLNQTMPHERECGVCHEKWLIEKDDIEFFKKFMVPVPVVCPHCSLVNKLIYRNERSLYKRKCDATGKDILSVISPDKPYKVYDKDVWWSDQFEALECGRDYDPGRSFFEQFNDLLLEVPYLSLMVTNNTNCDYINHANDCKNCYLVALSVKNEDCYYGKNVMSCQNCVDNLDIEKCVDCYECVGGINNNNCRFLFNSKNCYDCHFSEGLIGCQNCTLCFNLKNKQYCFAGEQLTKGEYEKRYNELDFGQKRKDFLQQRKTRVVKCLDIEKSENCVGDKIFNSKNCRQCFGISQGQDSKYVGDSINFAGEYDTYSAGTDSELIYNTTSLVKSYFQISSFACLGTSYTYYSFLSMFSKHLFGCVALKKKEYCILNKQYSREDYEKLVERIKLDMLERGEYGRYFPREICPYGYNET
ncbi:hypothetical protein KJ855_03885, partial [Patescibacteria group bacterium]|nr:hypothetical protein [Patescibacteria group bacterium]